MGYCYQREVRWDACPECEPWAHWMVQRQGVDPYSLAGDVGPHGRPAPDTPVQGSWRQMVQQLEVDILDPEDHSQGHSDLLDTGSNALRTGREHTGLEAETGHRIGARSGMSTVHHR